MDEATVRRIIREELQDLISTEKYTFQKHIQLFDARNIQLGKTTGTIIGTAADQKLGFFGKAPVVQQSSIAYPTGGTTVDSQARDKINGVIDVLDALGFTA